MSGPTVSTAVLEAALDYAARLGWPVFPVRRKVPAIKGGNGHHDATTDPDGIRDLWQRAGATVDGVGVDLERAGLILLDVDPRNGGDLDRLRAEFGPLPETPEAKTGSGGAHLFFLRPAACPATSAANGLGPGLDVKANGYAVLAPSRHPDGGAYAWHVPPGDIQPTSAPTWLIAPLTAKRNGARAHGADPAEVNDLAAYVRTAADGEFVKLAAARDGERNEALNRAAFTLGTLVGAGHLSEAEAVDVLRRGAMACGLWNEDGERACMATLRSGLESGKGQPRLIDLKPTPASTQPARARARSKAPPHCPPGAYRLEDVGNGERLVSLYGDRLLWCDPWSAWIVWDGKRWKVDDLAQAVDLAKRTATSIYAEAAAAAKSDDKDLADATWKHAKASNAAARLRSMLFVTQPDVATLPDNLDPDPWLFTVENGTVDLRTGELRPHNRDDLITKLTPIRYDPAAKCPTWLAFLDEVMAGDADRIGFLQRAIGYSLTGSTREQVLLILYGTGSNGKTTLLTVCQELLGDYGRQTPAETLLDPHRDSGSIPNDLAALKGARMVISAETEDGRRLAEAKVKAITGGDRISARFMRAEWFEYTPEFKVWLATNHRPVIRGTDYAIWRRIRLVPFGVTIPDERQDKELPSRLRAELSGILSWAVEGCLAWQRDGLGTPEAVEAATSAYRDDMDVLGGFLRDYCIQDGRAEAGATDLYKAYCAWCDDAGERAVSQRIFGSRLGERGFARERQRTGYVWRGIGLKVHDA